MRDVDDATQDLAFDRGAILRTHVLRPTWHFVAPADIRWLLKLTAPRVKAVLNTYARRLGLDDDVLLRSEVAIAHALEQSDTRDLTRSEVGDALRAAGVDVQDGGTLGQIVTRAELDGLVCSGPRRGRQHTYALLEERAPPVADWTEDEMLAELTWRYFNSHGPALVADCAWWCGLPNRTIARGLELNSGRLESESIDGRTYWFARSVDLPSMPERVYLLPNYDEYTVAYRHRELYYDAARNWTGNLRTDVPFGNVIVFRGQVVGRWKRAGAAIQCEWTIEASQTERAALAEAKDRYARYLRR
jgi:Winged helix DNA-binding domain